MGRTKLKREAALREEWSMKEDVVDDGLGHSRSIPSFSNLNISRTKKNAKTGLHRHKWKIEMRSNHRKQVQKAYHMRLA